jgi:hypothetical protein
MPGMKKMTMAEKTRKERGMKRASARAAGRTAAAKSRKAAKPAKGLSKAMKGSQYGTKAWN